MGICSGARVLNNSINSGTRYSLRDTRILDMEYGTKLLDPGEL